MQIEQMMVSVLTIIGLPAEATGGSGKLNAGDRRSGR